MKTLPLELRSWENCGFSGRLAFEVEDVELTVVLDGKFGASRFDALDFDGRGCSAARRRSVSAATIPPIECPQRMTWTEGSTIGDGVE